MESSCFSLLSSFWKKKEEKYVDEEPQRTVSVEEARGVVVRVLLLRNLCAVKRRGRMVAARAVLVANIVSDRGACSRGRGLLTSEN